MHAALPPTGQAKHTTSKKIWKFSIADSQASLIRKIKSVNDIQLEVQLWKEKYLEYRISCQPFVFMLEGNNEQTTYYCTYDNIIYKFVNLKTAITCAFKIHYVFNLEYQIECKTVWQFLQLYFFEINLDIGSTALSTLLTYLE